MQLTDEQFEKLAAFIEAAAEVAVSRGFQQNSVLAQVAEGRYAKRREAAKRALVRESTT